MSESPQAGTTSKIATTAVVIAAIALALPVLGVIGIHLGLLAPMAGFTLFAAGCLLGGLTSLVLGGLGWFMTRGGGDVEGRKRAKIALVGGVALLGVVGLSAGPSRDLPPINDITTDLADPPTFAGDPSGRDRDMSYPAEFVDQVRAGYPDLRAMESPLAPAAALGRAAERAEALGWEITRRDDATGVLEASDTTAIFQFVDDVVVRVRASGTVSKIDVRSKSRDGRGDLGANAERIRAFLAAYES